MGKECTLGVYGGGDSSVPTGSGPKIVVKIFLKFVFLEAFALFSRLHFIEQLRQRTNSNNIMLQSDKYHNNALTPNLFTYYKSMYYM